MGELITIYDVRENCVYADDQDGSAYVESISQRCFQTIASAQLYLQELLNLRLAARIASMQRYPDAYSNTPEAMASLAANKLHFEEEHWGPVLKLDLPIFFIKEEKVLY